ncbi:MAG: ATP-binding protein [Actinobacteria bacterium]|nr:ATP-binding protein [Actinomycetota bacterium]
MKEPDTTSIRLSVPADPSAPGTVRAAVRSLEAGLSPGTAADLDLLVTEVVTNSVRHAGMSPGDHIEVAVSLRPDRVLVEVWDRGHGYPRSGQAPVEHGSGAAWGLYLVERIADRWGVERGDRCRTWFELKAG